MPRPSTRTNDLASIDARREALRAELAALDKRAKDVELAAMDAGRETLLAAIAKVKIPAIAKGDAKAIALAIAKHGGAAVAANLAAIDTAP